MVNQLDSLQWWVQNNVPSVYDDSLSYYELLSKVLSQVNLDISTINELNTIITSDKWIERKYVKDGVIGAQQIDPLILSQPTTALGQQAKFEEIDKQFSDNMKFVSISKYANDLVSALTNENFISIPEGTFTVNSTLTRDMLLGKTIKGVSRKSILHFVGDIDCLQLYGIDQPTLIEDITIAVDDTNTKNAIIISPNNLVRVSELRMKGIFVKTLTGNQGQYTGLKYYDNSGHGIYKTSVDDIEIKNCKNGVIMQTDTLDNAWITHNLIRGLYVNIYSDKAIDFIQTKGAIACNVIPAPRINAGGTNTANDKTMMKVGGVDNFVTDITFFNDNGDGSNNYSFDLSEGNSHSNYLTGYVEGIIKNEENVVNHFINLLGTKNVKGLSYFNTPYQHYNNTITNLIKNYHFDYGLKGWLSSGATPTIDNTINSFFKNSLKMVSVGSAINIHRDLPLPSKLVGKYVTFTAKVTANCKCYAMIDEGTPGYTKGSYHSGSGQSELISITRKIDGGGIVRVLVATDDTTPGNTINVEWVCMNMGVSSPVNPVSGHTNYLSENRGVATIGASQTSVSIAHGLDVTPSLEDIVVTPIYYGSSPAVRLWVSSVNADNFTLNVDSLSTEISQFAWQINSYN